MAYSSFLGSLLVLSPSGGAKLYRECLQGLSSHPPECPAVTYNRDPAYTQPRTLMPVGQEIPRRGCNDRERRARLCVSSLPRACASVSPIVSPRDAPLSLCAINNGITCSYAAAPGLVSSSRQLCGLLMNFRVVFRAALASCRHCD